MNKLLDDLLNTSRRERELVNLFWVGFLIYTLSFTLSTTTLVSVNVCQFFQIIGLLLFLPSLFFIIKFRFENLYLQLLFILYLVWIAIIIARGIHLNYEDLKFNLFNAWFGGILYLVPLFLIFPRKLIYLKKIFNVLIVLAVFYILFDLAFIGYLINGDESNELSRGMLEYFSKTLGVSCFFLLMLFRYQSGRKKFFLVFIFLLTVFFALIRARRGILVMCGLTALFSYILYITQSGQKWFIILMSIVLGGVLILLGFEIFMANKNGFLYFIINRGLEDTRSSVEECFHEDMGSKDWLIGRGMMGEYFCPNVDSDDVTGFRYTIETDYLQIILKGGLISLLLFLFITIPAIFKGLFYSNNLLSKTAAMWILWILLNMYPSTVATFTMQYILLWISVGICYSPSFREIPEKVLVDYFMGYKYTNEIDKDIQSQKNK